MQKFGLLINYLHRCFYFDSFSYEIHAGSLTPAPLPLAGEGFFRKCAH